MGGIVAAILGLAATACAEGQRATSTVGMPTRIEQLVLPGSELEVRPIEDRRDPVVVRIVASYPHGSAFRYDLTYYALEPGQYDLRTYLRRKNGSALGELPAIPVSVAPLLPPGQIEPHPVSLEASPRFGGYRALMVVASTLWFMGLAYLLHRAYEARRAVRREAEAPATRADRLRPLVASAVAGELDPAGQAELERLLIAHWRERLGLEDERPTVLMSVLRQHPEAGPLFRAFEDWLHRPESERRDLGDELAGLLRPYLDAPPPARVEAVESGGRSA
jgi:hypothetical protein